MALFTEAAVKAGLRVKDGRRVFYLAPGDRLTASAREWLEHERIDIIPHAQTPPEQYQTLFGGVLQQKPEHMTHLYGNTLVFKDHPRIVFRGMIDALEAELLLCQKTAAREQEQQTVRQLQEILDFVRRLIRCDVLAQPVEPMHLCGLDAEQLREQSHHPQKYYGQPHFMPAWTDSDTLLHLNKVRTLIRRTELAGYRAFRTPDGATEREDILLALNRLSSLLWILMIQHKAKEAK